MSARLSSVENARQYLNGHPMRGACYSVKQDLNAPAAYRGTIAKVFPFDVFGLRFAEIYEHGIGRHICGPPVPFAYVIQNRSKQTRFHDYGRAMRYFAALVKYRARAFNEETGQ